MAERPGFKRRPRLAKRQTLPERISRVPQTARFIRTAAPAFFREVSNDYARPIVSAALRPHPELWPNQGLHAAWLGHSTVLLKIDGFSILTDPVFSTRIGLRLGPLTLGIKRLVEIALPLSDLPPVDLILLSHAHMDHFDLPTLRRLENPHAQIVTASQTSDLLRVRRYARVHELRWNESVQVGPAKITAFEVAHWGARMRGDIYRGYNGYLVEIGKMRVVFGGDTALTDTFKRLRTAEEKWI